MADGLNSRWRQRRAGLPRGGSVRRANDPLKKIIEINGVKVGVEWPRGSVRTWPHLPNNDYRVKMTADYGYIRQTEGEDGEEVDVYAGPDRDSDKVFKIEQLKKKKDGGGYDEDKFILGVGTKSEARALYLRHMDRECLGDVEELHWIEFLKIVPKSQGGIGGKTGKEKTAAKKIPFRKVLMSPDLLKPTQDDSAIDQEKVYSLIGEMEVNGYGFESTEIPPVIAVGDESGAELKDGHHRVDAARYLSLPVPVVLIDPKVYQSRGQEAIFAAFDWSERTAAAHPGVLTLYHGTSSKNLDSIKREGLRGGPEHELYLHADPEEARGWGSRNGDPVVLGISMDVLDESKLRADYQVADDSLGFDPENKAAIDLVNNPTWQKSLSVTGAVAYLGAIPPENIEFPAERRAAGEGQDKPVCPNCGQWQYYNRAEKRYDCLSECAKRGFASNLGKETPLEKSKLQDLADKYTVKHETKPGEPQLARSPVPAGEYRVVKEFTASNPEGKSSIVNHGMILTVHSNVGSSSVGFTMTDPADGRSWGGLSAEVARFTAATEFIKSDASNAKFREQHKKYLTLPGSTRENLDFKTLDPQDRQKKIDALLDRWNKEPDQRPQIEERLKSLRAFKALFMVRSGEMINKGDVVLWHGTTADVAQKVLQEGVTPQWGKFVSTHHGEGGAPIVFASDDQDLSSAARAMMNAVAAKTGTREGDVRAKAIREHGAMLEVVFDKVYQLTDIKETSAHDLNQESGWGIIDAKTGEPVDMDIPNGVEWGNFFSFDPGQVVGVHVGEDLMKFLSEHQDELSAFYGADFADMFTYEGSVRSRWLQRRAAASASPEFKAWFGNSQVVGADGSPMVVYHGTLSPGFNKFVANSVEQAIFFDESPDVASDFANPERTGNGEEWGAVMPCFLSIQNPKTVGPDEVYSDGAHSFEAMARTVRDAKDEGHDGLKIVGVTEIGGASSTQWAVFSPRQIKSATGNAGTFNRRKHDITASGEQKLLRELVCTVIGSDTGTTNEAVLPKGAVVGVQPWSNDHTIFFYSPVYSRIIVRGKVMKSNQYSAPVQDFRAATDIGYGEGTGYEHEPDCFCDECMANDDMGTNRCPSCGSRECPGDGHSIDCRKPGTMTVKDVPVETRDSLLDKFNKGEIDEKTLRRRMKQITSSLLGRWIARRAAPKKDNAYRVIIDLLVQKGGIEWDQLIEEATEKLGGDPASAIVDVSNALTKMFSEFRIDRISETGIVSMNSDLQMYADQIFQFICWNQQARNNEIIENMTKRNPGIQEGTVFSALDYLISDEKRAKWTNKGWLIMKEPQMSVEEAMSGFDPAPGSQPVDSVMEGVPSLDVGAERDRLLEEWQKNPDQRPQIEKKLKSLGAVRALWSMRRADMAPPKKSKRSAIDVITEAGFTPQILVGDLWTAFTKSGARERHDHAITSVHLTGSRWEGSHSPESDLDVVVFHSGNTLMSDATVAFRERVAEITGGRVDALLLPQTEPWGHPMSGNIMTMSRSADVSGGMFPEHWPDQITAFMQAFWDGTQAHPFMRNHRIWDNEVVMEVAPWAGGADPEYPWVISLKWLQAMTPGQGHATRAMQWLSALADEYGVFLDLHAKPTGEPKIPKTKLKNFYKDQGFERDRGQGPDDMIRNPKSGGLLGRWLRRIAVKPMKSLGPSLDKANNFFGKLDPEIRRRIVSYMSGPSADAWDDIKGIIISAGPGTGLGRSLWQAMLRIDPSFPQTGRSKDTEGNIVSDWERIPTPEQLMLAIELVVGRGERRAAGDISPNPDEDHALYEWQDSQVEQLPKQLQNVSEANWLGVRLENSGDIFRELTGRHHVGEGYVAEKVSKIERYLNEPARFGMPTPESLAIEGQIASLFEGVDRSGKSPRFSAACDLNIALAKRDWKAALDALARVRNPAPPKAASILSRWMSRRASMQKEAASFLLYHGSDADFDSFEEGHKNGWSNARQGFYFTDDQRAAGEFGRVRAFRVTMENPADLRYPESGRGERGLSVLGSSVLDSIVDKMPEELKGKYDGESIGMLASRGCFQTPEFIAATRAAGFDGIIMEDMLGSGGSGMAFDSYIAFDASQIVPAEEEKTEQASLRGRWLRRQAAKGEPTISVGEAKFDDLGGKTRIIRFPAKQLEEFMKMVMDMKRIDESGDQKAVAALRSNDAYFKAFRELQYDLVEFAAKLIVPDDAAREAAQTLHGTIDTFLEYWSREQADQRLRSEDPNYKNMMEQHEEQHSQETKEWLEKRRNEPPRKRQKNPGEMAKASEAILNILKDGPSDLFSKLTGSEFSPFADSTTDAIDMLIAIGRIEYNTGTKMFSIPGVTGPVGPQDHPAMSDFDRQQKIDALLEKMNAETDPVKKQQIEQRLRSLRAAARGMRRSARDVSGPPYGLNEMVSSYIEAALWSSIDEEGTNLDDSKYSDYEIDDASKEAIIEDCRSFMEKAGDLLDGLRTSAIGHDFWLTRCGHGAGFWDGDYEKSVGDALTNLCKEFGDIHIVADDEEHKFRFKNYAADQKRFEEAILKRLQEGPSFISEDGHELDTDVLPEDVPSLSVAIRKLLLFQKIVYNETNHSFSLADGFGTGAPAQAPSPAAPAAEPQPAAPDRQQQVDALLDQYLAETDPAKKEQLRQQMDSLRASVYDRWMARLAAISRQADIASRIPVLIKQFFPGEDPKLAEAHILALAKMDPTGEQGKYLTWLVKADSENNFSEHEYARVGELLAQYNKAKNKGGFPADKKDINRISFEQLDGLMQEYGNLQSQRELALSGQRVVRDDGQWKITEITSPESAAKLLQGKEWCVKDPQFSRQYLRSGPLFWVVPSKNSRVNGMGGGQEYLIHPASGEVKDSENLTPLRDAVELKEALGDDPHVGDAINGMKVDVEDILHGLGDQYEPSDIRTDDLSTALDLCLEESESHGQHLWDVIDEMKKRDISGLVSEYASAVNDSTRGQRDSNADLNRSIEPRDSSRKLLAALSRNSLGEAVFASGNASLMALFATRVLRARWPQAEPQIMANEEAREKYISGFPDYVDDLVPFYKEPLLGNPPPMPRNPDSGSGGRYEEPQDKLPLVDPDANLEYNQRPYNDSIIDESRRELERGEKKPEVHEETRRQQTLKPWKIPAENMVIPDVSNEEAKSMLNVDPEAPWRSLQQQPTPPWYKNLPRHTQEEFTPASLRTRWLQRRAAGSSFLFDPSENPIPFPVVGQRSCLWGSVYASDSANAEYGTDDLDELLFLVSNDSGLYHAFMDEFKAKNPEVQQEGPNAAIPVKDHPWVIPFLKRNFDRINREFVYPYFGKTDDGPGRWRGEAKRVIEIIRYTYGEARGEAELEKFLNRLKPGEREDFMEEAGKSGFEDFFSGLSDAIDKAKGVKRVKPSPKSEMFSKDIAAIPEVDPQAETDRLLGLLSTETDPEKKKQIEQKIRSIQASVHGRWLLRRAGDVGARLQNAKS